MKICKYKDKGKEKLLLFFNGWGASPELFARLEPDADMDYWVAYDYRMGFGMEEDLSAYKEVTVVAWSLGGHQRDTLSDARCVRYSPKNLLGNA